MTESLREEIIRVQKCLTDIECAVEYSDEPCADCRTDQILSLIIKRVKGIENPHIPLGYMPTDFEPRVRAESFDEAIQAVIKEIE